MDLKTFITNVPDFPKVGILFKDIFPLINNVKATQQAIKELTDGLDAANIDVVAGIESRGFLLGMLIAQHLDVGFVPIRKPGKLPGNTMVETYNLEYGLDTLEIQEHAIKSGDRVLLHDDVLATGGTASAACRLIEKCGATIVECNFLMELSHLNGRKKLKQRPVRALLEY